MTAISSSTYSMSSTGTLSSTGLGSGLDVTSIVSALVGAESIPLNTLKSAETTLQTKLSSYGQVKSYLSAVNDAAQKLADPTTFNATTGTSSNAAAVGISVGSNTPVGTYSVEVDQLAMPQSVMSSDFSSSSALVGAGTLSIQLGTQDKTANSFTAASSPAVNITVTATDTLSSLADKINASGAGVSATILNDGTGSRLVMRSSATGQANGFSVGATGDSGGLTRLAYDPTAASSLMTETQQAQDARAVINGMPVSSSINTLSQVLDGITLTLGAVTNPNYATTKTSDPTNNATLTVGSDTASIKTAMTNFVTAYNQLNSYLVTQTAYDASTGTAGDLQGDSTAISIRAQLRNMLGASPAASSTFTRLSDVGFDVATDGTLSVSDTKLTSALGNVAEVKKLFTNTDLTNSANDGVASQLRSLTNTMLGSQGSLTSKTTSIQASITRNESDQSAWQTRISNYQARVQAQYSALDTQMASLNQLSSYLTTQLAALAKSTSSS